MIWTVLLWLGMRVQTGPSGGYKPVFWHMNESVTAEGTWAAREHVFEIRTKPTGKIDWVYPAEPASVPYVEGFREACIAHGHKWIERLPRKCGYVRVTRELWIDGTRVGTVKGLDQ